MSSELGLNDHHHQQLIQYLRFARYQRGQRLRAVELCFDDLKDSRLMADTTFTRDEVAEMLDGLKVVVRGEAETELINSSHTNVLLLRQLCGQAEKWHLKLNADISELENKELLEAMQMFEDQQFSLSKSCDRVAITVLKKLEPLGAGGEATVLLQAEIDRLNAENSMLRQKAQHIESSATQFIEEKNRLAEELKSQKGQIATVTIQQPLNDGEVDKLQAQLTSLKTSLTHDLNASQTAAQQLESDLIGTQRRFLEVQEQLEMAEKELERKFSQTAAYKNLKKMLTQKNDQMKNYRSRLAKYEPAEAEGADVQD